MAHPVVVGSGKRLFGDAGETRGMRLVGTTSLGSGVVVMTYEPARDEEAGT